MAIFFPDIYSKNIKLTSGEHRFAARLQRKLEDDYLCWLQAVVGSRRYRPDFVIMHQQHGILVLEVKDWKINTILKGRSPVYLTLKTRHGEKSVDNPLEQARKYAMAIVNDLMHDSLLVQQEEGRYKGHLLMPWAYGAVLTNISRLQFEAEKLSDVISADLVICQDEMAEDVDTEEFQRRLGSMFKHNFGGMLSLAQIDRVRWHLFPEIRIHQYKLFPSETETPEEGGELNQFLPELMRVMDTQQEKIARSLGAGHRIIHGVAGSGKTLLLAYRCLQLYEQHPEKPILVLCFNKNLGAWLSNLMHAREAGNAVQVYHFHSWCRSICSRYKLNNLNINDEDKSEFYDEMVKAVIEGVEQKRVPLGQYSAILIDEGHDFEPEWFRLLVQMLDPQTESLLLLYDDAQSIYGRRSVSWANLGIKARGRSMILRVNYRNPIAVLDFAYSFLSAYQDGGDEKDAEIPRIRPKAGGRKGFRPSVRRFKNFTDEWNYLVEWLRERASAGVPYEDMAVLSRFKGQLSELNKAFSAQNLPVTINLTKPGVRLMTMHASKGLEFNSVVIHGLGSMPYVIQNTTLTPEAEAKLLYVAMTRATERLLITYSKESEFTKQCEALAAVGD